MPVKSEVPTIVSGPKYLNVSGPFPYAGEPQADWDARYAAAESEVPLDYVGHWVWGNAGNVGEMNAFGGELLLNVTGTEHTADQARLEALEEDDIIFVQQSGGTNTLTITSHLTVGGEIAFVIASEVPVGIMDGGLRTDIWVTPK